MDRQIKDGLPMEVLDKIYGRNVKGLIDNGATKWFVTLAYMATCISRAKPRYAFLELGNGKKTFIPRGYT